MTFESFLRARPIRAVLAFLTLLGALVLVPGGPAANAASDDLWITKSVDEATIASGNTSTWTLTVGTTTDATLATGIVVTDTLPDGLCPFDAGDPDCPAGLAATPAYSSATENEDGTWTLVWLIPDMGTSEELTIVYSTLTRTHYQEGFVDHAPVLARDSWVNTARVEGNVDGLNVNDAATASQIASSVTIAKDAASRSPALAQPEVCSDGTGLVWNPVRADGYRVGDQVCWRLSISYPANLTTLGSAVADSLPAGQAFTADDAWALGTNNTVPPGDVDGSTIDAGDATLNWSVGDGGGYVAAGSHLEIVFSTTILDPNASLSGQSMTSATSHSHATTRGALVAAADTAGVEVLEPEIALTKGVVAVNGASTGPGDGIDGASVKQSDVVTYQITVTNSGDIEATDLTVWDLLAPEYTACTTRVAAISGGGSCVDAFNRIEWSGPAAVTVPAGNSVSLTYNVTIPPGISPSETLNNDAGVRTFVSATNNGTGIFTYVPASNVDAGISGQNTTSAGDSSHVVTPAPTLSNTRTTTVDEGGNHDATQATIGELVTYSSTLVIPEGTTVYGASLVVDLPLNLDLTSSAYVFDGEQLVNRMEEGTLDQVTVQFPDPAYTNAPGSGEDKLTLTVVGRVIDSPLNVRGTVIDNTAEFSWLDQAGDAHLVDASVITTVVEPLLGIGKSSVDSVGNNGTVFGNEVVDYTITVSNPGTSSVSTAHDLVIVDSLPEGVTLEFPVSDSGLWASDAVPGNGIGGTITWDVPSLSPGFSIDLTYQVTVDDPVVVNSTFVNHAVVDASSMMGTPLMERTSGVGYHAERGHVLNTPLGSIAQSVSPQVATVGDVVTYQVEVTMPPGTIMYDATVIGTLPTGLAFDRLVSSSCDMAGSSCDPQITASELGAAGSAEAAFFLGDIDSSSATGETRVVTITYQAHVLDLGSAGNRRMSLVRAYGNQIDRVSGPPAIPLDVDSFDVAIGPAAATVTVAEPRLAIDKDVSGQTADDDERRAVPGENLVYTIVASNSGAVHTSDAYDITIVDTVPEGVAVNLPVAGGGVWTPDGTPGDGIGGVITWTEVGPLAPGDSVTHTYEVEIDATLDSADENPGGAELVGAADVASYFGVSTLNRIANPTFSYRNYNNVAADVVAVEMDLASVAGVVWFDVDANGIQDAGEPTFAGIDLAVVYLGLNAASSSDDEAHPVTTAGDGSYVVNSLPGGSYVIDVSTSGLPAGFVASYDLDDGILSPDDGWGAGPIAEDEDKLDVDFGYTGTGSIGDAVWFDSDGDGSKDPEEYGLEGVSVTVTWLGIDGVSGGDDVQYRTTTDSSGAFLASRLPAGNYTTTVNPLTLPSGMQGTYDADGIGSADVSTVALIATEDNEDQDFGYSGSGVIGDSVWLDRNGDGSQDIGEPGLAGVPIQLTWPGENEALGGGDDGLFLATTDANGYYWFENMPPGEYQLDVLGGLPAAAANTFDEDGGMDSSTIVNLLDAESHDITDFGFQGTASIGDIVWWDFDGDGELDAGEPGIEAVEMVLTYAGLDDVVGTTDDLAFTTLTDANGAYVFTDLPAGNYRVAVVGGLPTGMVPTHDEDSALDETSLVTGLLYDGIHLTSDFGYDGTGSVGDFIWLDLNADGMQDVSEPGLPDVDVDLTWFGVDGVVASADDVVISTVTDVDGGYLFSGLPGGGYDVVVDPVSLPPGVSQTFDHDGVASGGLSSLVLGAGASDLDQDFGYNGGGSIGDTVWFDHNRDGVFDNSEYGISGVDVALIWAGPDVTYGTADDETFAMVTDATGHYLALNLPLGHYAVVVNPASLPPGMAPVADEDGVLDNQSVVLLGDGEVHLTVDFGYAGGGEIGNLIWFDGNADGNQNPDEPGIPSQDVQLTAAGADGVLGTVDDETYATTTDADGEYRFGNLPPGDYALEVTGPITAHGFNTADEDGDNNSSTVVDLGDAVSHQTADFGYRGDVEIGDLVWLDLDANGIFDGEQGLAGAELTLTWHGPDGLFGGVDDMVAAVLVTEVDGSYLATQLMTGDYTVAVTAGVPEGFVNSSDRDGELDSQTVVAGTTTGSSYMSSDFGYAGAGAFGGTVWWDLDGSQEQADEEPGIVAVEVFATWAGRDDVFATPDDAVFVTSTDSAGTYLFSDTPPGRFEVEADLGALLPVIVQSADPDPVLDGRSIISMDAFAANSSVSFGYRGDSTTGGFIWYDVNGNGVRDAAEPGVSGAAIAVTYFGPDETGGTEDDVTFVTDTAAGGTFVIPGLPSGFYEVAIDESSLPEGTTVVGDRDGGEPAKTSLSLGAATLDVGLGYPVIGDATLQGAVWNDRNGDEFVDPDEVGVSGVGVSVTWDGPAGEVAVVVVSDAHGLWQVSHLPPGLYSVDLDMATAPQGMSATTATQWPAVVDPAESIVLDFGLALLLDVGSRVWVDGDGNGVFGLAEEGVSGVLVNLYNELGALVEIAETDSHGTYLFADIFPGIYSVRLDRDTVPSHLRPTWDRDGDHDFLTVVDMTAGADVLDASFGFQAGLPITGFEVGTLALWGSLMTLLGIALVAACPSGRFESAAQTQPGVAL